MVLASIVLALLAAVGLAVGTHLQHHSVRTGNDVNSSTVERPLVLRPIWLLGLCLLGLETVLNVAALGLGPVALVQPIGTVSLVIAVLISVKVLGRRVSAPMAASVGLTLVSVAGFVGISARYAQTAPLIPGAVTWLNGMLILFSMVGAVLAATRAGHLLLVAVAGVTFGTVAASAHVIATSVLAVVGVGGGWSGVLEVFSGGLLITALGVVLGSVTGMWAVQVAYSSGPPETVLAGLSVIDPMMAVLIGVAVLGEYRHLDLPALAGLAVTGAAAVTGVVLLSKFHPCTAQKAVEGLADTHGVTDEPDRVRVRMSV